MLALRSHGIGSSSTVRPLGRRSRRMELSTVSVIRGLYRPAHESRVRQQLSECGARISTPGQARADEHGVSQTAYLLQLIRRAVARFGDEQTCKARGSRTPHQPGRSPQVDLQGGQVAVVDADDAGTAGQRKLELRFVVH